MKKLAFILLSLLAGVCLAGDDYVATVAYTGTAGCSSELRPKAKYAVRCTTDCHVRVTSSASIVATTNDVKLLADKLYDVPTTATQRYLCAVQVSSGGNMLIYLNRGPQE